MPLLLAPGYVLGWLLNIVSFRGQDSATKLLLSLSLTIACTPVLIYLLGKFFAFTAIWIFYALCSVGAAALLSRAHKQTVCGRLPFLIAAVWMVIALASLADVQFGNALYPTVVSYDYLFRSATVGAISRAHWLPPANPFFYPGHPVPFRYHYFWFMISSLPNRIAPGLISPRQALMGGTVWIGLALMATVLLYQRFFEKRADLRRCAIAGVLLLGVSGLDIIPIGLMDLSVLTLHKGWFYPTVDWWNPDQVTGWLDSMLWVPHDIAALIACLIGYLILHQPRKSWRDLLASGIAFASAAGLSIFVTLVFAIFIALWILFCAIRKDFRTARSFAMAGCIAALGAFPFLWELQSAGTPASGFVSFGLRQFAPVHLFFDPPVTHWLDLLFLPLNYFLEFGLFFVVGILKLRRPRRIEDAPAMLMAGASIVVCTFIRSTSILFDDLGTRGMLPAQFILLLWAAGILSETNTARWRPAIKVTLFLGLATSAYELLILRTAFFLGDSHLAPKQIWVATDDRFGKRTFALRTTYEWLERHTPQDAIVQPNPRVFQEIFGGLYSNRQYALASTYFGDFGGSVAQFQDYATRLPRIFEPGSREAEAMALCRELSIDVLVYKDIDPIWSDPSAWIWKRQPLFANEFSRTFACGSRVTAGATIGIP